MVLQIACCSVLGYSHEKYVSLPTFLDQKVDCEECEEGHVLGCQPLPIMLLLYSQGVLARSLLKHSASKSIYEFSHSRPCSRVAFAECVSVVYSFQVSFCF